MEIEYKVTNKKAVPFCDLKIGDCYRDVDGDEICIKVGTDRCLFLNRGEWISMIENTSDTKIPLKATLVVEE